MGKIFLEREIDYFLYDTVGEINAKAAELIALMTGSIEAVEAELAESQLSGLGLLLTRGKVKVIRMPGPDYFEKHGLVCGNNRCVERGAAYPCEYDPLLPS